MNSLRSRLIEAACDHKKTHMRFSPYEPESLGPTIEVCNECGHSRSHWEQGESKWTDVDVSDFPKA